MKPRFYIFLLSFFIVACHTHSGDKAQERNSKDTAKKNDTVKDEEKKLKNTMVIHSIHDTIAILTDFFSPQKIVDGIAYWDPPDSDNTDEQISSDGLCHSNIDEIFKIPGDKNDAHLVVFTSYEYDDKGKREDYHAAEATYDMALLSKDGDSYTIKNSARSFDMCGCWGNGGTVTLENFGKEYVLHISSGFTGQGYTQIFENYFNIHNGEIVFTFQSLDDNSGAYDSTDGSYSSTDENLKPVPDKTGDWDKLKLLGKKSHFDSISHKMIDSTYSLTYIMNTDSNYYTKTKR